MICQCLNQSHHTWIHFRESQAPESETEPSECVTKAGAGKEWLRWEDTLKQKRTTTTTITMKQKTQSK